MTQPDVKNPEIRIIVEAEEGQVDIHVMDNGPGIEPADRERIFTKFSRAWTTARPTSTGAGLGLAITRAILRRMNGTLDLLPSKGRGACFRVALPLYREAAAPGPDAL